MQKYTKQKLLRYQLRLGCVNNCYPRRFLSKIIHLYLLSSKIQDLTIFFPLILPVEDY